MSFRVKGPVGYWRETEPTDWQYSPLTPVSPGFDDGPRVSVGQPDD